MAKHFQVFQSQLRSQTVVQHDVCISLDSSMSRHRDDWHWQGLVERRIYSNQSFHRTVQQQAWIFADEVRPVAMAHNEVEITGLDKVLLNAAHHLGAIAFTDLRDDNADGEASLPKERTSEEIRPVIKTLGGVQDSALGVLRDSLCPGGPIYHHGDA